MGGGGNQISELKKKTKTRRKKRKKKKGWEGQSHSGNGWQACLKKIGNSFLGGGLCWRNGKEKMKFKRKERERLLRQ